MSHSLISGPGYGHDTTVPNALIIIIKEIACRRLRVRQKKRKLREEVLLPYKIQRYVEVTSERLWTHGFIEYHVVRRENKHYRFIEADYINFHPHDIDDMFLRRANSYNKKGISQDILKSLEIFMRSWVVVVHVEDFHMGIKSYEKRINLTPPMLACP
ncbi:hypothetical protein Tco_1414189, partial [Tanacetum coccineum]